MYWDKPAENAEPVQVPAISGVMLASFSIFIVLGGLMPLFLNPCLLYTSYCIGVRHIGARDCRIYDDGYFALCGY